MTSFRCTNILSHILYILISTYFITTYAGTIRTTTSNEYLNQIINCTANEACYVYCEDSQACESATIYCATNQPCEVTCESNSACDGTIIHAEYSSIFKLLDCATGFWTCVGMTLYLPPNYYGQIRAFVLGADRGFSAGSNNANLLQFYAIYGWKDVSITTTNDYDNQNQAGIMHCTTDYSVSCSISDTKWECDTANAICNDPYPPTMSPTISPTTSSTDPTLYPTLEPTINTMTPTIDPTQQTKAPNTEIGPKGKNDGLSLRPSQQYQTLSTTNVNTEALFVAIGLIGGFFVITVIIACKIWRKHEKNHRPLYHERTQQMINESTAENNYEQNNNNKINGSANVLELETMNVTDAVETQID